MATPIPAGGVLLHVVLPVADLAAACAFYDPLLALLGLNRRVTGLESAGYGRGPTPTIWLRCAPAGTRPADPDRFSRLALAAPSREALEQARRLIQAAGLAPAEPVSRKPMQGGLAWGLEWVDADGNWLSLVLAAADEPHGGRRDRFADSGHGEMPDYPNA